MLGSRFVLSLLRWFLWYCDVSDLMSAPRELFFVKCMGMWEIAVVICGCLIHMRSELEKASFL